MPLWPWCLALSTLLFQASDSSVHSFARSFDTNNIRQRSSDRICSQCRAKYSSTSCSEKQFPIRIRSSDSWRDPRKEVEWSIALHGGSGEIKDVKSIPERIRALELILEHGITMLKSGHSALDTVTACTVLLEDCIYFNAGRGSVFTHNGTHEMDACIMDGSDMRAGACACVSRVKNPILLARKIMEETRHILLVG
mmetsp:Transcript_85235/g.227333  ORF Transcript_85235/g.227333 Transcript_85235/m.227333 type:complete len:196 (-) Transcript_85235:125-712(-)